MLIVSLIELKEAEVIIKELGYLPLAIEQAGAYIWAQGASFAEYLLEYKNNFQSVTEKKPEGLEGYATVYTTWQISLEAIKAENPQATELLYLYGFLSNDVSDELILHGAEWQILESNGKKQLKKCIELLLSYSVVKRDGGKNRVWIHPVVHEWTRQHLTTSEKQEQTKHALNIVFKYIDQHSKQENSEKMLVVARNILPDVEACVKNVIDYLQDKPEFNQGSWKHLMALGDFLQSRGIYGLSCAIAKMLNNEHKRCLGCEHLDTLQSMNTLAILYRHQGKYADTETLYKEALVEGLTLSHAS